MIGYGRPPEHAYTTALARLCAALADLLPVPDGDQGPSGGGRSSDAASRNGMTARARSGELKMS